MVRDIEDNKNVTADVTLKNGTQYMGKDVPSKPTGEHGQFFSFWLDRNTLMTYPMTEVANIKINTY